MTEMTQEWSELHGEFTDQRRARRTQVHIADVGVGDQEEFFYVDLPGWTSDKVIRLRKADLGPELAKKLKVDARWHARVNIGAEDSWELYFRDWEPCERCQPERFGKDGEHD